MIQPLADRVLVEFSEDGEKITEYGIIITDKPTKEKKTQGVVVALGDSEEVKSSGLVVSDVVLFPQYSGDEVEEGDKKYRIVKVEEIIAKLEL